MNFKAYYAYYICLVFFTSYANCMEKKLQDRDTELYTAVNFTIENSTGITFESITIKPNSSCRPYFIANPIAPGECACFAFPAKQGSSCPVAVKIIPRLSIYQIGIQSIPTSIPPFVLQICGNTSIKITLSKNVFGIERQVVIENKTQKQIIAFASGPLVEYSNSGVQIYIISPNSAISFNIFIPLGVFIPRHISDLKPTQENPIKIGTVIYDVDTNARLDLIFNYPIGGDQDALTLNF